MREIQVSTIGLWITACEKNIWRNSNNLQSKPEYCNTFFHQIKLHEPLWRKESIQTVIRTSRRLHSIFIWNHSNIQSETKKSKTYSSWCSFQCLSNGTTLMEIQSGQTVPLKEPCMKSLFSLNVRMFTFLSFLMTGYTNIVYTFQWNLFDILEKL